MKDLKIFLLGDLKEGHGPGTANRTLLKGMKEAGNAATYYLPRGKSRIGRAFEDMLRGVTCDVVFVMDHTRLHMLAMWAAHVAGKKIVCRVHGHIAYEWGMEHPGAAVARKKRKRKQEERFYQYADILACVSELSARKLCADYPRLAGKIRVCYNPVDTGVLLRAGECVGAKIHTALPKHSDKNPGRCTGQEGFTELAGHSDKNPGKCTGQESFTVLPGHSDKNPGRCTGAEPGSMAESSEYLIVSAGGGLRQKNNLAIAHAIENLRTKTGLACRYLVVGPPGTDKQEICKYPFVEYHDRLPHKQFLKRMEQADLYIQNSTFETFGIAALEALLLGCNLLVSENMGVCEIIEGLRDADMIQDVSDTDEIERKLAAVLKDRNQERLGRSVRLDLLDRKSVATWFHRLFRNCYSERL